MSKRLRRMHKILNETRYPVVFNEQASAILAAASGLRGDPVKVRSKYSGHQGLAYVSDPHIFIEGVGVSGWYRIESLDRNFLKT